MRLPLRLVQSAETKEALPMTDVKLDKLIVRLLAHRPTRDGVVEIHKSLLDAVTQAIQDYRAMIKEQNK